MKINSKFVPFCFYYTGLVKASNLKGIHERYMGTLSIMNQKGCSLAESMRIFDVARNTLRDFIGICELKIVDSSKYERVVQSVKEATGKASVKVIESYCREALGEYRNQTNWLKSEKKLLPFYPKDGFYMRK